MPEASRRRMRPWMLLVPAVILVGLIVAASLLQRPAPPGAQIANQPLPEKHQTGPCFECHEGMSTAAQIASRPLPDPHPPDRCADCHEGYTADPG